ncbi:unnamed protein product (macronuclear) [Paramecium tetraurelia]|uniref:Uncharacterized protein n=1 Tax=Paramecium tetraurelia TaxID=5888 RepID=A0EEX3_PARTE|nr:uncharacterized protein GSPATT00026187001 [Paramecium tetraurelia]CAK93864.1 unnamed protein product [Paramecium tetraurelia]|eukprot:XP_001461237.1 hypothetical protein (macronuclear) [Paramecium tetraurelia strain d4-2]
MFITQNQKNKNAHQDIIDSDFQSNVINQELKSFVQKIQDRQKRLSELSKQLEETIQKSLSINSTIFERELRSKQKEMRKTKLENEKRVTKIKRDYDLTENSNLSKLLQKQQEYRTHYDQLYQEEIHFVKFLDQQTKNSSYFSVINSILNDSLIFSGQKLDNSSVLEYLTGQNKHKIPNFHNSIKLTIQQLQNIEENLQFIVNSNNMTDSQLQLLQQSLSNFINVLKTTQTSIDEILLEMELIQKEISDSDKIRKNNIILIQSIIKENQDQKESEIQEFIKLNDSLLKQLMSVVEINRRYSIFQLQSNEDLQKLSQLSEIQFQSICQIENKKQNKQGCASLKKIPTVLLSKSRKFSDHYKELNELINKSNDQSLELGVKRDSMALESSFLYQSQQATNPEKPILNILLQKQMRSQSPNSTKHIEKKSPLIHHITYKTIAHVDKKTALPLRCSCPPQCLCSSQIITQIHQCNCQLYINSKGYIMCQQCQFSQQIQDYGFYCPQNRQKNKFKNYEDFLFSFWLHLTTLTINEQIVEFWDNLQVNCQRQWIQCKQIEFNDQMDETNVINLIAYCPSNSKCYHKTSQQQIHFCQSPLLINSLGELICRKCNFFGNPQFHFIQCPEQKGFYFYQNIDLFLNSIDLNNSNFESEKQNLEFLQKLRKNLLKKWK